VHGVQSQAARADWSLATHILLRKTRTDFCKTLLRRHCSRRLHAVVLHWRLACACGGFRGEGGGGGGSGAAAGEGGCSGSKEDGSAGMDQGVVRRVTWARGGSRTNTLNDTSDGSSWGGMSAGDGGAVS